MPADAFKQALHPCRGPTHFLNRRTSGLAESALASDPNRGKLSASHRKFSRSCECACDGSRLLMASAIGSGRAAPELNGPGASPEIDSPFWHESWQRRLTCRPIGGIGSGSLRENVLRQRAGWFWCSGGKHIICRYKRSEGSSAVTQRHHSSVPVGPTHALDLRVEKKTPSLESLIYGNQEEKEERTIEKTRQKKKKKKKEEQKKRE